MNIVVGGTYGRLTVLSIDGALASCVCSCGAERVVRRRNIGSHTKSCGCLAKAAHSKMCKPGRGGISLRREYAG